MDLDTSFGGSDTPVQEPTESTEPTVQAEDEVIEDLSDPFLKNIPPQERAVVSRYVKEWNSGAQKKFREYVGRIKPYEQLGSVEDLQKITAFVRNLQSNPEPFFRALYLGLEERAGENFQQELNRILQREAEMADDYEQTGYEYEEPDEDTVWRGNIEQELEDFRAWREQQEQSREEAAQFEALDNYIAQMHNQFGEFDDTFILSRLAEGRNAQQAFQDWQAMGAKYFGGTQRQAPKTLGGQGGVPTQQVDAKTLRGRDRRGAVEALLAGLQE